MASESIVDDYIDSLFAFGFSEADSVNEAVATIDANQTLVPTFKTPNKLGQSMLMAQQLLSLASQMPPSRLKQHCLDTGLNALLCGAKMNSQTTETGSNNTPNLNDLLQFSTLVR